MNKQLMFNGLLVVLFSSMGFCGTALADSENDEEKGDRKGVEGRREPARRPSMADWSPEDREGMKKVLRVVWEKVEVLQARDEVKRATEAFRSAVQEAMQQEDPRLAALMKKMHDKGRGQAGGRRESGLHAGPPHGSGTGGDLRKGGRPPMKKMRQHRGREMDGSRPDGGGPAIGPAGFRALPKDFSQKDKRRLAAAQEKAMQAEAYKTSQQKLQGLFKQGQELRKQRVAMFQQIREQLRKQMIEADPEVQVLLERLEKKRVKRDRAPAESQ
ncbi:MAG: hypothetical protein L3J39_17625 [Verrucomicrobiales bacterium]|nr:hypothetical protein [Verrucomicrobiales bacterium]